MKKETRRLEMIQSYSDFYKEVYGFRPRHDYSNYTIEELESDFRRFDELCEENRKEEEDFNNRAIVDFEKRVNSIIEMGAGDRETALRWIVESYETHDLFYGADWLVSYEFGIGYNEYANKLKSEFEPMISNYIEKTS